MSSSASRVWTTSGRPVVARRLDMRAEALALGGAVGLVVIIIEPALADRDHARVRRRLDQRRGAEVGMGVGLVRVDADAGPDVGVRAPRRAITASHSRWRVEMLRKPVTPRARAAASTSSWRSARPVVDRGGNGYRSGSCGVSASSSRGKIGDRLGDRRAVLAAVDQREQLGRPTPGRPARSPWRAGAPRRRSCRAPAAIRSGSVFLQRPRRHGVDIGIAGEHRAHPRLDPRREGEAVELGRQRGAALVDQRRARRRPRALRPRREGRRPNS